MTLATLAAGILLLWPGVGGTSPAQSNGGQSAQTSQPSSQASTSQPSGQNQQTPASQPCSEGQSKPPAGCKPAKPKTKKPPVHKEIKADDTSPNKKVIRNGGTGEPTVAISSDEGQRQARIQETNRMLAAADLNLKDVAVRGVSPNQEVTVKQIRSYIDEAKAAANSGDVERAYNLANKANMLAADLNGR
ncbi:MAG TPA: hypothetical protein VJQ82_21230 [Terriglobales bacterium]|nr:hypothetical protein [Terriglobales bacterium]